MLGPAVTALHTLPENRAALLVPNASPTVGAGASRARRPLGGRLGKRYKHSLVLQSPWSLLWPYMQCAPALIYIIESQNHGTAQVGGDLKSSSGPTFLGKGSLNKIG